MSEPKLISPLLDNYIMGEPISSHDGVCCCPAIHKQTNERYIVKIISVPASQAQLDAMLLTGAYESKDAALTYYNSVAKDIEAETDTLQKLSQLEGFVSYEACQIQPLEGDETGFDVYLLGTYKRTLARLLKKESMTHLAAMNLALDMCAALSTCRQAGYLFIDLKPDNIYILEDQGYKIGDLGFVALNSLKFASVPDRYRSKYTAPELADPFAELNTTVDIYALGLILYQIFNDGILPSPNEEEPSAQIAPPAYADYEMAEIILKACAVEPTMRWQDPVEMGQAIVSYMQRNGAHDTPIAPAPAEDATSAVTEQEAGAYTEDARENGENAEVVAETEPEEPAVTEESIYAEDSHGNLTFLDDSTDDETAPDMNAAEVPYDEVSDEVSEILAQADDLIAHETPDLTGQLEFDADMQATEEPQIPAEIEVAETESPEDPAEAEAEAPVAETVTEEAEETTAPDAEAQSAEDTAEDAPEAVETTADETPEAVETTAEDTQQNAEAAVTTAVALEESDEEEQFEEDVTIRKRKKPWIIHVIIAVILLALVAGGILFYRNYYLQPIESIKLEETAEGVLTVYVESQIDESKLTVLCVDTYGNPRSESIKNGKAVFTGLAPGSAYTVKVVTNGFHRLTGDLSVAYTTPSVTNILHLKAETGMEDGSVKLSFTVEGPDSDQWRATYADDNNIKQEVEFFGHVAEISGLTIGKSYEFKIQPVNDISFTGENTVTHVANKVMKTPKVEITGFVDGVVSVAWANIDDVDVESWTVRCYNETDYDKTITTSENTATFRVTDPDANYTVEVAVTGMSVTVPAYAVANSLSITKFNLDNSNPNEFTLTWDATVDPTDGWILLYSINDGPAKEITCKTENKATISPIVPGCTYSLSLQPADGSAVLGGNRKFTVPEADDFSGYGITSDNLQIYMVRTPAKSNWTRVDLKKTDYVTWFTSGEKASFLIRILSGRENSEDEVTTLLVIKDAEGNILSTTAAVKTWSQMWSDSYFEVDIQNMPQSAGNYTISIYFDGQFVHQNEFTVA